MVVLTENSKPQSLSELIVEKRSGNSEKFEEEKLVRGISRAGIPFLIAKDISKTIINKLTDNPSIENIINSNQIREYVVEELKQRNHGTIAESYSGYSKNKITSIKEEQVKNNKYNSKVSQSTITPSKQYAKDRDNTSGRGTKTGI